MATSVRVKACGGLAPYIWSVSGPATVNPSTGTATTVSCSADSATAVVVTVTDAVGVSVSQSVGGSCQCAGCDYELGTRSNFVQSGTCADCNDVESMTYTAGTTVKFIERQISTGTKTECPGDVCPNLGPIVATISGYLCNSECPITAAALSTGNVIRLRITSGHANLNGGTCTDVTINGAEFPVSWTMAYGADVDTIPSSGSQCVITSGGGVVLCLPECE